MKIPALKRSSVVFFLSIFGIILFRRILTSDLHLIVSGFSGDDGLYVKRAFHLLHGGSLGPYDAELLIKPPGFSFLLALIRCTGLSYLVALETILLISSLYLLFQVRASGVQRLWCTLLFFVLLINPVTLLSLWARIYREPLLYCSFIMLAASSIAWVRNLERGTTPLFHGVVFVLSFLMVLNNREEDLYFLWFYLISFAIAGWWYLPSAGRKSVCLLVLCAFIMGRASTVFTRHWIEKKYGVHVLEEIFEGEYPKVMHALGMVGKQSPHPRHQISREALEAVRFEFPEYRFLLDPIIAQHFGQMTYVQVNNAIRQRAVSAGYYSSARDAQQFYRTLREKIEEACRNGHFKCRTESSTFLPLPPKSEGYRYFFSEMVNNLHACLYGLGVGSWFLLPPGVVGVENETTKREFEFIGREPVLNILGTGTALKIKPVTHTLVERTRNSVLFFYQRAGYLLLWLCIAAGLILLFFPVGGRSVPLGLFTISFTFYSFVRFVSFSYLSIFRELVARQFYVSYGFLFVMGVIILGEVSRLYRNKSPEESFGRIL